MRLLSLILVSSMLVGCARPAGNLLTWPVHVQAVEGFPPDAEARLRQYMKDMNDLMGGGVFTDDETIGSPVTVRMVSQFSGSSNADGTSGGLRIAGRATVSDEYCEVEIADFVATDTKNQLLEPVTMHEFGHCGGLHHTGAGLMAPTTLAWPTYTTDDKDEFKDEFLTSIGVKK